MSVALYPVPVPPVQGIHLHQHTRPPRQLSCMTGREGGRGRGGRGREGDGGGREEEGGGGRGTEGGGEGGRRGGRGSGKGNYMDILLH